MIPSPAPVLLLARELGIGGSERQLTEIAKNLDRKRFKPIVGYFRPGSLCNELAEADVPLLPFDLRSFASLDAMRQAERFRRHLQAQHIAIVHAFDYPTACFAVPIAKAAGVPVVLASQRSHRDLIPVCYRKYTAITDLIADGIVVNCEHIRKHLVDVHGVPCRRIHVCYNGVDTRTFTSAPAGDESPREMVIGSVSALRPEKNIPLLVTAFSRLARTRSDVTLLIAGSGPESAALRHLVGPLGLSERVVFTTASEKVTSWLHRMDIFVLPSRTEGLSNALMEAMASELPAVASNVGGTPELIEHGRTGLLFQSENVADLAGALLRLIENRPLRFELGANARKLMVERFSLEAATDQMSRLYENFLNRTKPVGSS